MILQNHNNCFIWQNTISQKCIEMHLTGTLLCLLLKILKMNEQSSTEIPKNSLDSHVIILWICCSSWSHAEVDTLTHMSLASHCMKHISQRKTDYTVWSPTSISTIQINRLSICWEANAAFHILSSELSYLSTVSALLQVSKVCINWFLLTFLTGL